MSGQPLPLYRAQILLEPKQHTVLAEIARQQGRSLSDVMREIVRQYLDAKSEALRKQLDAFEQIKRHRAEMMARRGGKPIDIDLVALIEETRQERANELFTNTLNRGD